MTSRIPVIDIAPYFSGNEAARRLVAEAVDGACTDLGFLIVSGHGVPDSLIGDMRRVSKAFFDLPLEEKQAAISK